MVLNVKNFKYAFWVNVVAPSRSHFCYQHLYLSFSLSLSLSVCVCVCLCVSFFSSVSVFLCLSLSFSVFLCLSLSFSVFLCLSLSFSVFLCLSLPTYVSKIKAKSRSKCGWDFRAERKQFETKNLLIYFNRILV